MPAYRSAAEAEVRDAVVARLRQLRPDARIMHEVNASSFANRIDVLAVSPAEIIAVEVKSAKDKLDRLPDQLTAMRGCAHHVIAALHEKFARVVETRWQPDFERDGQGYARFGPEGLGGTTTWLFPEMRVRWREPAASITTPLPPAAVDMLWREELRAMCHAFGLPASSRLAMPALVATLRWNLTGRQVTQGICATLRARQCIEADDAVEWSVAA
jgi:hypothetical protein